MRTRAVALLCLTAAATLLLGGCGVEYEPEYAQAKAAATLTVAHLEYIPASKKTVTDSSCMGDGVTVPLICTNSDREVLEKQCWRVDVARDWTFRGKAYHEVLDHFCVFPSEFKTIKVGDAWTKPAVTY